MEDERSAWIVRGLTDYAERMKILGSELIKNYQMDHRTKDLRIWPPSAGVLTYLKANLPEGCTIEEEELAKKEKKKVPPVIHRMGMNIED
jgi:hypothetical protein